MLKAAGCLMMCTNSPSPPATARVKKDCPTKNACLSEVTRTRFNQFSVTSEPAVRTASRRPATCGFRPLARRPTSNAFTCRSRGRPLGARSSRQMPWALPTSRTTGFEPRGSNSSGDESKTALAVRAFPPESDLCPSRASRSWRWAIAHRQPT